MILIKRLSRFLISLEKITEENYKGDFAIRKKKKDNQKLQENRNKMQKLYKKENKIIVHPLIK